MMTTDSSRQEVTELVVSNEYSKDLYYTNSWNCTEVFLNDIVHAVMANLDDVRCDSDMFCPKRNGGTHAILHDLEIFECRQGAPPAAGQQEQERAPAAKPLTVTISPIKEKYSMDSINSILDSDSFDEYEDVKRLVLEEFDDESVSSDVAVAKVHDNIEALVTQFSQELAAMGHHEVISAPVKAAGMDGGSEDGEATAELLQGVARNSLNPMVATEATVDTTDDTDTKELEPNTDRSIEDILLVNEDCEVTADLLQGVARNSLNPMVATEAIVDTTDDTDTKELEPNTERSIEEILLVNEDTTYEDVVSLIENSFLPNEAIAKAIHGADHPYFDDNEVEKRGIEKFRCSLLPFFC